WALDRPHVLHRPLSVLLCRAAISPACSIQHVTCIHAEAPVRSRSVPAPLITGLGATAPGFLWFRDELWCSACPEAGRRRGHRARGPESSRRTCRHLRGQDGCPRGIEHGAISPRGYCSIIAERASASASIASPPSTSTMTLAMRPVKRKGAR